MSLKHRSGPKIWFCVSAFYPPEKIRGAFATYQKAKQLADVLEKEHKYGFHVMRIELCK